MPLKELAIAKKRARCRLLYSQYQCECLRFGFWAVFLSFKIARFFISNEEQEDHDQDQEEEAWGQDRTRQDKRNRTKNQCILSNLPLVLDPTNLQAIQCPTPSLLAASRVVVSLSQRSSSLLILFSQSIATHYVIVSSIAIVGFWPYMSLLGINLVIELPVVLSAHEA